MGEAIAKVGYLGGLCGHDGTGWLKVKTDANGYLYVVGTGTTGAMEVTQDTPAELLTGIHGYIDAAWKKQGLIFAYYDRYYDIKLESSGVGDNNVNVAKVLDGYMYYVQYVEYYHEEGSPIVIDIMAITDTAATMNIYHDASAATSTRLSQPVGVCLKKDDYIRGVFRGMTSGHTIYVVLWGYKMKLGM